MGWRVGVEETSVLAAIVSIAIVSIALVSIDLGVGGLVSILTAPILTTTSVLAAPAVSSIPSSSSSCSNNTHSGRGRSRVRKG